ncbi:MAG: S8 family serine peptidase [Vulcanimicrobiota bacterium]
MAIIRATGPTLPLTPSTRPDTFTPSQEPKFDLEDRLELTAARAQEIEAGMGEHVPNQVLVKLPAGTDQAAMKALAADYGANLAQVFTIPDQMKAAFDGELALLELPTGLAESSALAALEVDQRVKSAASNDLMRLQNLPNDLHEEQWNLKNNGQFGKVGADIHAEQAWDITTGDRVNGPIVAVIDSGIDIAHPDLRPNLWRNPNEKYDGQDTDRNGLIDDVFGVDTQNGNGNIVDWLGHGTHVSGIIGAVGDNGQGVAGINWQTRLMGLKVADGQGRISMVGAIFSVLYATQMGAKIANNSWGGLVDNPILKDVLGASPMLHVCAAGNYQNDNDVRPFYPASYDLPNLISVGASTRRDEPLTFSNWGANSVDVHAPGAMVYSTLPRENYDEESGTSMAAPHVSGVAALVATVYPDLTAEQLKDRLIYSADPIADLHGKSVSGGRLNAYRALADDKIAPGNLGNPEMKSLDADGFEVSWVNPGDDGDQGQLNHIEMFATVAGQKQRLTPAFPGAPGSAGEFTFRLTPTPEARSLEVTMRAIDKVGNKSDTVTFEKTLPAATTALFDDAEGQVAWQTDSWGRVAEEGRGMVWTDTPNGDYEDSHDYTMVGPSLDLSKMRSTTLTFDARMATEKWDFLWLEASTDGGEEWGHIGIVRGDASPEWTGYSFDMSAFDGQPDVKLRLRFHTSNSQTGDGVYVDNIRVLGAEIGA